MDFDVEVAFSAWLDTDLYGPSLPNLNPKLVYKGMQTEDNLGMVIEWPDNVVEKVVKFYAAMHEVILY